MKKLSAITLLLSVITFWGCGEERTWPNRNDSGTSDQDRGIVTQPDAGEDASGMGGAGGTAGMGDAGGMAGAGGVGGMGGVGGTGGAGGGGGMMTVEIDSCEDACDRYDACARTGDVFGTRDDCLSRCGRITRDGDGWRS